MSTRIPEPRTLALDADGAPRLRSPRRAISAHGWLGGEADVYASMG
jgi:hypothetical protein